jgi:hypothetical protein
MSSIIEELRKRGSMTSKPKQEIVCSSQKNTGLTALKNMSNGLGELNKESFEQQITAIGSRIIEETSKIYYEQTVEVLFLIDKSGSCKGTEMATCKSYDYLIAKEKKENFKTIVTNILFAEGQEEVTFRKDIKEVGSLDYKANGAWTALYDTVCISIQKILNAQKKDMNAPKKTIVAIMTDGCDNFPDDRKKYSCSDAKRAIEMAKKRGWEFIFLGAGEKAHTEANFLGIHPDNIARIDMSDEGMVANFLAIEKAIQSVRENGKVDSSWKKSIQNLSLESKDKAKQLKLELK